MYFCRGVLNRVVFCDFSSSSSFDCLYIFYIFVYFALLFFLQISLLSLFFPQIYFNLHIKFYRRYLQILRLAPPLATPLVPLRPRKIIYAVKFGFSYKYPTRQQPIMTVLKALVRAFECVV